MTYFFNIHFNVVLHSVPCCQLWIKTAVKLSSNTHLISLKHIRDPIVIAFHMCILHLTLFKNFILGFCEDGIPTPLVCLRTLCCLFYLWRNNHHLLSGLTSLLQSTTLFSWNCTYKYPGSASIRHKAIISHQLLWHTKYIEYIWPPHILGQHPW
jgi:hypothetical protein